MYVHEALARPALNICDNLIMHGCQLETHIHKLFVKKKQFYPPTG